MHFREEVKAEIENSLKFRHLALLDRFGGYFESLDKRGVEGEEALKLFGFVLVFGTKKVLQNFRIE